MKDIVYERQSISSEKDIIEAREEQNEIETMFDEMQQYWAFRLANQKCTGENINEVPSQPQPSGQNECICCCRMLMYLILTVIRAHENVGSYNRPYLKYYTCLYGKKILNREFSLREIEDRFGIDHATGARHFEKINIEINAVSCVFEIGAYLKESISVFLSDDRISLVSVEDTQEKLLDVLSSFTKSNPKQSDPLYLLSLALTHKETRTIINYAPELVAEASRLHNSLNRSMTGTAWPIFEQLIADSLIIYNKTTKGIMS